jgi:hypothetical protein
MLLWKGLLSRLKRYSNAAVVALIGCAACACAQDAADSGVADPVLAHAALLLDQGVQKYLELDPKQTKRISERLRQCGASDVTVSFQCQSDAGGGELIGSFSPAQYSRFLGLVLRTEPRLLLEDDAVKARLKISSPQVEQLRGAVERYESVRAEALNAARRIRFRSSLEKQQFFLMRTEASRADVLSELTSNQRASIGAASLSDVLKGSPADDESQPSP